MYVSSILGNWSINSRGHVVLTVYTPHLNGHTDRFESVTEMKTNLIEEFGDQVPSQLDFSVGYYDRSQKAKTWLVIKDHLDALYKKYPNGGNTALWCDGRSTDSAPK